jgi:methylmalonyl-CoA mutase cobalamin-binding domain/chain
VNKYRPAEAEQIDVRVVDNKSVRDSQLRRLAEVRAARDGRAVESALAALTKAAEDGSGNLLALAVAAARSRATLGEISTALEKVFGRYQAVNRTISGVYSSESQDNPDFRKARELAEEFAGLEGRRPRILMAKMGQDGHDRGAKVIATAFADMGFDVDVGPLFQTPREAARMAVENDVHVLGVSSLAGGHTTLVPEVIAELKNLGRADIQVVVGRSDSAAGLRSSVRGGSGGSLRSRHGDPGGRAEDSERADRECACGVGATWRFASGTAVHGDKLVFSPGQAKAYPTWGMLQLACRDSPASRSSAERSADSVHIPGTS